MNTAKPPWIDLAVSARTWMPSRRSSTGVLQVVVVGDDRGFELVDFPQHTEQDLVELGGVVPTAGKNLVHGDQLYTRSPFAFGPYCAESVTSGSYPAVHPASHGFTKLRIVIQGGWTLSFQPVTATVEMF